MFLQKWHRSLNNLKGSILITTIGLTFGCGQVVFTEKSNEESSPSTGSTDQSPLDMTEKSATMPVPISGTLLVYSCDKAIIQQAEAMVGCRMRLENLPHAKITELSWSYQLDPAWPSTTISFELKTLQDADVEYRIKGENSAELDKILKKFVAVATYKDIEQKIEIGSTVYRNLVPTVCNNGGGVGSGNGNCPRNEGIVTQ